MSTVNAPPANGTTVVQKVAPITGVVGNSQWNASTGQFEIWVEGQDTNGKSWAQWFPADMFDAQP